MYRCLLLLSLIFSWHALSQENYTISGYVKSESAGETLIGATVKTHVNGELTGTVTNQYGFFSLSLPRGIYELSISFVGLAAQEHVIDLSSNQQLTVELSANKTLQTVTVKAEADNSNITGTEMSVQKLSMSEIRKMPALMGEVDVIKAIQLLPGVATVGEGGSGFYVRGGSVDQNLILLDEANVYNASHLMGFFSVFNPDVVKEVQLYKGGIPAEYGGRLSSVLDVRMKEGNMKRFALNGGIGTISSRLSLGGPIVKDKGSVIISGRRTYADAFLPLSKNEDIRDSKLHFYDFNLKANYRLNEKNRVYLSGYFGRDVLGLNNRLRMDWGNATSSLRWNHVFSDKLFMNATATFSNYDYFLGEPQGLDAYEWTSNIKDYSIKTDFTYYLNPNNTLKFGAVGAFHQIDPGQASGVGESVLDEFVVPLTNALEYASYLSHQLKIGKRFNATYGVRLSAFQNIGATTYYDYNTNFDVSDTIEVNKGEIYNTYWGIEPRAGMSFLLNENASLKASYNRTFQYIHLASNSTASSPLDIWFPSSPNVKPQRADQFALGYFQNIAQNTYQSSIEVYYKKMSNAIDFEDHATLLLNPLLEGELRFGEARAYGAEFLVKKTKGKLNGWIGYTLSRTQRKINEINEGEWYFAKYDKTHDLSVVLSYDFNKSWSISTNFVYSTGAAVTMPIGKMEYMGMTVPIYSERNGKRMPDYHRLDFAVCWKPKKSFEKKWKSEWVLSCYNIYNRANPYSINFVTDENDPTQTRAEMLYLFGVVPSITYNFRF